MHKPKIIMDTTDSPKQYKMARKYYLASSTAKGISCVFCPFHAKENQEHKLQRNWKKFRKTKHKV